MKKCPVCQVEITDDDRVLFSYGEPGTRSRLYARVCQYAKKEGCINKGPHVIKQGDSYTPVETSDYTDFIKEIMND